MVPVISALPAATGQTSAGILEKSLPDDITSESAEGMGFMALFSSQIQPLLQEGQLAKLVQNTPLQQGEAALLEYVEQAAKDGKILPQDVSRDLKDLIKSLSADLKNTAQTVLKDVEITGRYADKLVDNNAVLLPRLSELPVDKLISDKFLAQLGRDGATGLEGIKKVIDSDNLSQTLPSFSHHPVRSASVNGAATSFSAIMSPLQSTDWGQQLASRVVWQVGKGVQEAQISLNPRELGPVQVKVSMVNDQATVHFHAHHGVVREAITEAIPQLKEMLEQSGLMLADANVSHQSAEKDSPMADEFNIAAEDEEADVLAEEDSDNNVRTLLGLVDAYV